MTLLTALPEHAAHVQRVVTNLTDPGNRLLLADGDPFWSSHRSNLIDDARREFGDQPTAHAFLRAFTFGVSAGLVLEAVEDALTWSPSAGTPMLWRRFAANSGEDVPVSVADWPSYVDAYAEHPRLAHSAVIVRYDVVTGELHRMRVARSQLSVRDLGPSA